ncbi:MAG: dihydroneopterin aldolase [Rickettsiales bacterium]
METRFQACLGVHRLRLSTTLGYGRGERSKPQPVEIELRLFFKDMPLASIDEASPFLCYDKLSQCLQELVQNREFKLIEYMASVAMKEIRTSIIDQMGQEAAKNIFIWMKLHKCVPPVPYMLGGASIILSDLPQGLTAADAI